MGSLPPPVSPAAPTTNKTMGSVAGGLGGGGAGSAVVALLDYRYHITMSPELASIVGGIAATILGGIATFFMPLVTAGQQAILRKLEAEGH